MPLLLILEEASSGRIEYYSLESFHKLSVIESSGFANCTIAAMA